MAKKNLSLRVSLLQKKIRQEKIKALLITDAYNVRYLSDFTGSNGQILLTSQQAFFLTDFRYLSVAKKILPPSLKVIDMKEGFLKTLEKLLIQKNITALHFEEKNLTYTTYKNFKKNLKRTRLKSSENLVESMRIIKSDEEIKLITKAQSLAEKVFIEVRNNLKVGKTERQIAWEIEKLGHEFGADGISFPAIVGFNENSASPHHQCSDKKLKKGDVILIDMGMQYQGYCSDMTRMVFTKEPTAFQKKIYNIVLEAQEKSAQKIKAGVKGNVVDQCAREIIAKAGYGETFGHSLGHGIGLEVHENPALSPRYPKIIPDRTIVTVEPGIYLENSFGVRIEDMVLVKGNRIVNLTKIPKKIEDTVFLIS